MQGVTVALLLMLLAAAAAAAQLSRFATPPASHSILGALNTLYTPRRSGTVKDGPSTSRAL